jgi:ABC-type Mn2+/Zn2+ transport system permease subunit
MLGGLLLSYYLNLPSGAVIVLTGSATFALVFAASALCRKRH